eukprot:1276312-Rhodomonas_salina.1
MCGCSRLLSQRPGRERWAYPRRNQRRKHTRSVPFVPRARVPAFDSATHLIPDTVGSQDDAAIFWNEGVDGYFGLGYHSNVFACGDSQESIRSISSHFTQFSQETPHAPGRAHVIYTKKEREKEGAW